MPAIVRIIIAYAEPVCWRKPVDILNANTICYLGAISIYNSNKNGDADDDAIADINEVLHAIFVHRRINFSIAHRHALPRRHFCCRGRLLPLPCGLVLHGRQRSTGGVRRAYLQHPGKDLCFRLPAMLLHAGLHKQRQWLYRLLGRGRHVHGVPSRLIWQL
jgi:hypothetical protein